MIFTYSARLVAPYDFAISISEGEMWRTPARVSSTMIQIANRKTAAMMVFSPKPNRIISTGTSADSGALEKMLTHMPSNSSASLTRPIRMPSGTPTRIDRVMPMTKARSVVTVALCQDGVCTSSTAARSTSVNGGSISIRSSRPTISQTTHQTSSDAIIGTR